MLVIVEIFPAMGAKPNPDYKAQLVGVQAAPPKLPTEDQLVAQR
jgi:hypothetical protein